jgi:hypothetical protein
MMNFTGNIVLSGYLLKVFNKFSFPYFLNIFNKVCVKMENKVLDLFS